MPAPPDSDSTPNLVPDLAPNLAVVVPALNAELPLGKLLGQLEGERVVVADGGSEDGTLRVAVRAGAVVAAGARGRGAQLRLGARHAMAHLDAEGWLLFLHADTRLPEDWRTLVDAHMDARPERAAYFGFGGEGDWRVVRSLRGLVRLRELAWGLPYGDQGLLVSARLYREVGGFLSMDLFEDVDLVVRLRRASGRLVRLRGRIGTDLAAYHRDGVWRRGLRNLRLLRLYRHGVPVEELLRRYRSEP